MQAIFERMFHSPQMYRVTWTAEIDSPQGHPFTIKIGYGISGVTYPTGPLGQCDGGREAFTYGQVFVHELIHHEPETRGLPISPGTAANELDAMRRGRQRLQRRQGAEESLCALESAFAE